MKDLSRRDFLKLTGLATGSVLLPGRVVLRQPIQPFPLRKRVGEAYSICPYCSVGCGLIVATDEAGHITNVEGDPDHPHNRGALDPKSISVRQLSTSPLRLSKVLYRAPGSSAWEEKRWDWAMGEIAKRIQKTRNETFARTFKVADKDVAVNRTEGIAWLGGAANNNEDCYLGSKFARALGMVYVEHQARI